MLVTFATMLLVAFAMAPAAAADGGTVGRVVVPGDHFQPGESLAISGSKISGRHVSIRLTNGGTSVDLAEADVALDGTFEVSAVVPASFPLGYAELIATDELDNDVSTIILIGDRAEGPGSAPDVSELIDDRAVGLTLAALGTLLFLIASAWYVRSRPKETRRPD